jgi:hypothetical protein
MKKSWDKVGSIHSLTRPKSHSLVVSLYSCYGNAARAGTDLAVDASATAVEAETELLSLPSFAEAQTLDESKASRVNWQTCCSGRGNERVNVEYRQKVISRLLIRRYRTSRPPLDWPTRSKHICTNGDATNTTLTT